MLRTPPRNSCGAAYLFCSAAGKLDGGVRSAQPEDTNAPPRDIAGVARAVIGPEIPPTRGPPFGRSITGGSRELVSEDEGTYAVISDLTISLPSAMTFPQHQPALAAGGRRGARPLALRIGYDMHFELAGPLPTAMLFMLYVHPEVAPRARPPRSDSCSTRTSKSRRSRTPSATAAPASSRRRRPAGVARRGLPRRPRPRAAARPVGPAAPRRRAARRALPFLLGSRYCEVDRLSAVAWDLFGKLPPGGERLAINEWVFKNIRFGYRFTRPNKTALDTYVERTGVCRDMMHLAITFCRAMNIPARYATGYLGDIDADPDPTPMDFSAFYEVYLDGRWWPMDARHGKARVGRVLMARGRDATDVALVTSFGRHRLTKFTVVTDEISTQAAPAAAAAPHLPLALGAWRHHAISSRMTCPCTSVSRRSMPLWRTVSRSWSMPEQVQHRRVDVVAVGRVGRVGGLVRPLVALAVASMPPLIPPPASQLVKTNGLWSRPLLPWLQGIRPNSVVQRTSVSSSMPRCFRSLISAAAPVAMPRPSGQWSRARSSWLSQLRRGKPLSAPAPDLHEPHAALEQPPGDQAVAAEVAGLLAGVHRAVVLHVRARRGRRGRGRAAARRRCRAPRARTSCILAASSYERMRASSRRVAVRASASCRRLSCSSGREHVRARRRGLTNGAFGREEVGDRVVGAGADHRALVLGREEPGAPVLRAVGREAARVGQHDERRQVVVQLPQAVADPAPRRWGSPAGRSPSPA